VRSYAKNSKNLIVCGGGSFNLQLMQRLQALLPELAVESSDAHGLAAMHVEAAAFAWLAQQTLLRRALDYCAITGAQGPRVLGAIYPA
jgi:anhydro-N-acetylmuramic acid kinase